MTTTASNSIDQLLIDNEKLLTGYQNLLEMAKSQLESFDLSEEHITAIARKVQTEAITEAGKVAANKAMEALIDQIDNSSGRLNHYINNEVERRINSLLQNGFYDRIREIIDSEEIKNLLASRIRNATDERYTQLDEALEERTRRRFRALLTSAFDDEELNAMAARHQSNTSEQ